VKAVSLRGVHGGESRVSESGFFLISGLGHTTHLLVVMQGEAVVHQQLVKVSRDGKNSTSVSIDLSRR
jgi:hypothetical protein